MMFAWLRNNNKDDVSGKSTRQSNDAPPGSTPNSVTTLNPAWEGQGKALDAKEEPTNTTTLNNQKTRRKRLILLAAFLFCSAVVALVLTLVLSPQQSCDMKSEVTTMQSKSLAPVKIQLVFEQGCFTVNSTLSECNENDQAQLWTVASDFFVTINGLCIPLDGDGAAQVVPCEQVEFAARLWNGFIVDSIEEPTVCLGQEFGGGSGIEVRDFDDETDACLEVSLKSPSPVQIIHKASGQCVISNGHGNDLSIGDCSGDDAETSSWDVTGDSVTSADGLLCIDTGVARNPKVVSCDDSHAGQVLWMNQYGRLGSTNGKCLVVDANSRSILTDDTCQNGYNESQALIINTFAKQVTTGCREFCLSHGGFSTALRLDRGCSSESISQGWIVDGGRVSSGSFCFDSGAAEPRVLPCADSDAQLVELRDSRFHFPATGKCLVVDKQASNIRFAPQSSEECSHSDPIIVSRMKGCKSTDDNINGLCCSEQAPCGEGEGRCLADSDCTAGLVCGMQNCRAYGWGGIVDNCCEPAPVRRCQVNDFASLGQAVLNCPTGIVDIVVDDLHFERAIGIAQGRMVSIHGAGSDGKTRLTTQDPDGTFFRIFGDEVVLEDLVMVSDMSATRPAVQVKGATANVVLNDCDFDVGSNVVSAQDGASVLASGSKLYSNDKSVPVIIGCETCDVRVSTSMLRVHSLASPLVKEARDLEVSDIDLDLSEALNEQSGISQRRRRRLQAVGSGIVDARTVQRFTARDSRKLYRSFADCTSNTLLRSFIADSPTKCAQACDTDDACEGLRWQLDVSKIEIPDNLSQEQVEANPELVKVDPAKITSSCEIYSNVDMGSCVPIDSADDTFYFGLFRVVVETERPEDVYEAYEINSFGQNRPRKICLVASTGSIVELTNMDSKQECRVWCKYYSPYCRAFEYDSDLNTCLLGASIESFRTDELDCVGDDSTNPEILHSIMEYDAIGMECAPQAAQVGRNILGIRNATRSCATLCEQRGERCVAIEVDNENEDCRLIQELALSPEAFTTRCRRRSVVQGNMQYEIRLPRSSEWFDFPKHTFLAHANSQANDQFCSVSADSETLAPMRSEEKSDTFASCKRACARDAFCAAFELVDYDVTDDNYLCVFKSSAAFAPCQSVSISHVPRRLFLFSSTSDFFDVQSVGNLTGVIDDQSEAGEEEEEEEEPPTPVTIADAFVTQGMTFDSCRLLCYLDQWCNEFAYLAANSTCVSESSALQVLDPVSPFQVPLGQPVYSANLIAFNASYQQFIGYQGHAYAYGMTSLIARGLDECRQYCTHNVLCRAFAWTPDRDSNYGTCSMYRGVNVDTQDKQDNTPTKSLTISTLQYTFESDAAVQREYQNWTGIFRPLGEPLGGQLEITGVDQVDDCMMLCEIERHCNVFTFDGSICLLFKASERRTDNVTQGEPQVFFAESDFEYDFIPPGLCLYGARLEDLEDVTLEECKKACGRVVEDTKDAQTPDRCESFRYDYENGICKLHRGLELKQCGQKPPTVSEFRSVTRFRDEDVSFVVVKDACSLDADFGVLQQLTNRSLARCERGCELDPDCKAFLYDSLDRTCELLDSAKFSTDPSKCSTSFADFYIRFKADKFTRLEGMCPGQDVETLLNMRNNSVQECAIICDALLDCRAFSFNVADDSCDLLSSTWAESSNACKDQDQRQFYIEHSQLYYTEDTGVCGNADLESDKQSRQLFTRDECKALCTAQGVSCFGFNYDRVAMKCVLQGPLTNDDCVTGANSCACGEETTLYVSFRHERQTESSVRYVGNMACHGTLIETQNISGSMDRCMRECSLRPACKTVSRDDILGLCILGSESDFTYGSGCSGVLLKRPIEPFGELIDVPVNPADKLQTYLDKNPAECRALCASRKDCVDVMRPLACPNQPVTRPECFLSTSADYDKSGDIDTYCEDPPPTPPPGAEIMDVSVYKTRFLFGTEMARLCKGDIQVLATVDVASKDECADICVDRDMCIGFEYETTVLSGFNCATFSNATEDLDKLYGESCSDEEQPVSGRFFPRTTRPLQTLSKTEYDARIWLRDPSARVGKAMYKAVNVLKREAGQFVSKLGAAALASSASLGVLGILIESMQAVGAGILALVPTMLGLEMGMKLAMPLVGSIPYVGAAFRSILTIVRTVIRISRKVLQKIYSKLIKSKAPKAEKGYEKLTKMDGALQAGSGVVRPIAPALYIVSIVLIKAHKCAFDARDLQLVDTLEGVMEAVTTTALEIAAVLSKVPSSVLNPLGRFPTLSANLLSHLKSITLGPLAKLGRILGPLDWLAKLPSLRFRIPKVKIWPGVTLFPGVTITMQGLAKFLSPLGWLFDWLPLEGIFTSVFPRVTLPDLGIDFARFNFLDNLELDILGAYDDLFQALTMPTLRIDILLDDLRDLLPTDFNLPCDLGDEFADFALGNDGGGDDGDESSPPAASAVSALRATTSTTKKKPFVAYIFLADVLKNGISNILARKAKQVKSVVKAVTRKQRLMAQKAKLAGKKFVAKLSLASPITVGAGAIKYATSVRVNPIPMLRQKLYVIFQLVEKAAGKVYKGPKCFLPVNHKTGSVQSATRKGTRQSFLSMINNGVRSAAVFPLQFNATVNPWATDRSRLKVSLEAVVKTNPKLPTGTCDDLCPTGARCDKTKMSTSSSRLISSRTSKLESKSFAAFIGPEPDNFKTESFYTYAALRASDDLFVRKETFGFCYVYNSWFEDIFLRNEGNAFFDSGQGPNSQDVSEAIKEDFLRNGLFKVGGDWWLRMCADHSVVGLGSDIYNWQIGKDIKKAETSIFRKYLKAAKILCTPITRTEISQKLGLGNGCDAPPGGIQCSRADEYGGWGGKTTKAEMAGFQRKDNCNNGFDGQYFRYRYEVEHVFDFKRRHGFNQFGKPHGMFQFNPNSMANFVMAWGVWNGQIGRPSWSTDQIQKEKEIVYTPGVYKHIKKLSEICNGVVHGLGDDEMVGVFRNCRPELQHRPLSPWTIGVAGQPVNTLGNSANDKEDCGNEEEDGNSCMEI